MLGFCLEPFLAVLVLFPTCRRAVDLPGVFRAEGLSAAAAYAGCGVHTFYNDWMKMGRRIFFLPFSLSNRGYVCKSMSNYVKVSTLAVALHSLEPRVVQMWFKYSKNIPNNTKLFGKSYQQKFVEYVEVRRFCAEVAEGSLVDLFSDAKNMILSIETFWKVIGL